MELLKKFLAIAMLLFLALPAAVSAFALAQKSEANLPACCRKGGKHHCAMNAAGSHDGVVRVSAPVEKCPFAPHSLPAGHGVSWFPMNSHVGVLQHTRESSVVAQAESMRRVSKERTRQKRGPPILSLL